MTTQQDGGPVYPTNESNYENAGGYCGPGLTLRDHFAGLAMQGKISCGLWSHLSPEKMAAVAYEQADAMIRARGDSPKQEAPE